MRKTGSVLCAGIVAIGLWGATPAQAQKKSVAEEILDILRANNQISDQQYRDLLNKARSEEEQTVGLQEQINKATKSDGMRVYWSSGLRLDSSDGDFKLKIGGRIQNDWTIYGTDHELRDAVNDGESIGDGTEFRRARMYMEGAIYNNIEYKLQLDFAGGEIAFKDAYIELNKIPYLGNYRVGQFKEPFSLEELTSSKYITFMERSLPNTLVPSRHTGMMLHNTAFNKQMTWAIGVFRESDDAGNGFGPDSNYDLTARLTALPWYLEKGRQLVHLGLSYSHRFRDDQDIRFRARPEAHLGPRFVDTSDIPTNDIDLIGPEFAAVFGPASLQAEWVRAIVDAPEGSDHHFDGWYVYGGYFLTGEHRPYKTSSGAFDRVKPLRNFDWNGGLGAWEVGVRYSYLDLNDDDIRGGILGDFTFGVNWYLNPNVRFMLNYVLADRKSGGEADIIQSRFQVDF